MGGGESKQAKGQPFESRQIFNMFSENTILTIFMIVDQMVGCEGRNF